MPYEISTTSDGGLFTRFWGDIVDKEMVQATVDRYEHEQFMASKYLLADYSEVEKYDVTPVGIRALARLAENYAQDKETLVIIAIMPKPILYGMARMCQGFAPDDVTGWSTYVVETQEEALQLLAQHFAEK